MLFIINADNAKIRVCQIAPTNPYLQLQLIQFYQSRSLCTLFHFLKDFNTLTYCDPVFIQAVEDAVPTKAKKKLTKYKYPYNVISTAWVLMMAARRIPFTFRKGECRFVKNLDCLRAIGKSAYGGGHALSANRQSLPSAQAMKPNAQAMKPR